MTSPRECTLKTKMANAEEYFLFGETILKHFLDIMEEDEGIKGHFTAALNNVSELS